MNPISAAAVLYLVLSFTSAGTVSIDVTSGTSVLLLASGMAGIGLWQKRKVLPW
jgi:hypothetical protein